MEIKKVVIIATLSLLIAALVFPPFSISQYGVIMEHFAKFDFLLTVGSSAAAEDRFYTDAVYLINWPILGVILSVICLIGGLVYCFVNK